MQNKNLTLSSFLKLIAITIILAGISFACKTGTDYNKNADFSTQKPEERKHDGRPPRPPRRSVNKNRPADFITKGDTINSTKLHKAFTEFDVNETDIFISDDNVVIESTGLPNHTTPYWGEGHELYIKPKTALVKHMTPTTLQSTNHDSTMSLTIPQNPAKAEKTTATNMGAIGIAVSGAAIFNDQEGNGPLSDNVASGLDYAGGHIGPAEYHYHLEPTPITHDDEKLVGIIVDGFFIYGRKCNSTGTYPTDLDASGGHTHVTQHSNKAEYHYHIINELYGNTGKSLLFVGPYQGTPNAVN